MDIYRSSCILLCIPPSELKSDTDSTGYLILHSVCSASLKCRSDGNYPFYSLDLTPNFRDKLESVSRKVPLCGAFLLVGATKVDMDGYYSSCILFHIYFF